MGCDIHGYVEYNGWGLWRDCISIKPIVGRNYDMFALLFGVRNDAAFIPVAPDRGMPVNVSDRVKEEYERWGEDAHSPSWITWQEIAQINWNGQGTQLADRVFCYRPGEDTSFQSFRMASYLTDEDYRLLDKGETIERFDRFEGTTVLYRREVQKTSDAISDDWQCLFDLMKRLDEYHRASDNRRESNIIESKPVPAIPVDDSKVRLVVWFDN